MQRTSYAFILAAFVILSGCHGGDAAAPQPAATEMNNAIESAPISTASSSTTSIKDTRPLMVCFGDSLTAGYGAEAGKSYPDYLQADLDKEGFHYRVVNKGVSGATSKDGVTRLPDVVALKPAIVVVEFGGNDGLRGLPVRDLRANLEKMIATLQASGTKVVLAGITLPPDYGPDYVSQFTASYPLLAKKYNVPLLPFLLQGVFGVDGMMQQDLTHATAKGNEVVARNVLELVQPLLRK